MVTTSVGVPPASVPRSLFGVFTNPRAVLQSHFTTLPAPLCLLVSGLAFCLFYLQTGLDLVHKGSHGLAFALGLAAVGAAVGTVGVGLLAALAWAMSRPFGKAQPLGWAVRVFALGYFPALLYAVLGLIANLAWGWHTSLAFGVTGVLWALGPMLVAIREMTGRRTGPAVVIATVCGALTLVLWALIVR